MVGPLSKAMMQILNLPGVVEQLMGALSNGGILDVQVVAAITISFFSENFLWIGANLEQEMKKFRQKGVTEGLSSLLAEQHSPKTQRCAAAALTFLNHSEGNQARLYCGAAYFRRGCANFLLDFYKEALTDYDNAIDLEPLEESALRERRTVKVRLGDMEGALADADNIIEVQRKRAHLEKAKDDFAHDLQERGVLKLKMGDLQGALADLEEGLDVGGDTYEILKHRGYVAFLLADEEKARFYAERALKLQRPGFDWPFNQKSSLGRSPVEYLDYKL